MNQNCPEKINLLPMYGKVPKCVAQIESDKIFLADCDKQFNSRKEAAKYHIDRAWNYFYKGQLDTSIMRFNQAWLLDSLNADVYWGFGNILGLKKQFKESIFYFQKSIKLNPLNPNVYECISTSYGQLFFETKKIDFLNLTFDNLNKAIQLNPNNAELYGQLTGAYSYFNQKDSALKYLKIADKLDPNSINPEVRKILMSK